MKEENNLCSFCSINSSEKENELKVSLAKCISTNIQSVGESTYEYETIDVNISRCEKCCNIHESIKTNYGIYRFFSGFIYYPLIILLFMFALGTLLEIKSSSDLIWGISAGLLFFVLIFGKKALDGMILKSIEKGLQKSGERTNKSFSSIFKTIETNPTIEQLLQLKDVYDSFFIVYKSLPNFLRRTGKDYYLKRVDKIVKLSRMEQADELIKARMNLKM